MRTDDPVVTALAERWKSLRETGLRLAFGLALALGLAGAAFSLSAITPGLRRAREGRARGAGSA